MAELFDRLQDCAQHESLKPALALAAMLPVAAATRVVGAERRFAPAEAMTRDPRSGFSAARGVKMGQPELIDFSEDTGRIRGRIQPHLSLE